MIRHRRDDSWETCQRQRLNDRLPKTSFPLQMKGIALPQEMIAEKVLSRLWMPSTPARFGQAW